uniref:MRG domain-containing protein n=1 Tax=Panagrolaimus superbus TaxID=310955 RepID=A0A914YEH9_9BILA
MLSKKRGSDNSNRSSRPSSSKSTARQEEQRQSEENSRDTNGRENSNLGSNEIPSEYKLGSKVLCKHTDLFFYEAKIIDVTKNDGKTLYTIHYQGWNNRYDEIIPHDVAVHKFLALTPENVAMANKEREEAKKNKKRARSSIKNKKEINPAVPYKKNRSTTPARTNTSARNTPVDPGEFKPPSKVGPSTLTSVLSEPPTAIPLRLHKKRAEFKLPSALLEVLVKDAEMIEKQSKLVKLPASITIDKIIEDYESSERNPYSQIPGGDDMLVGNLDALIKTFAQRLSSELIFKFEISQFLEMLNKKRNELGYSDITVAQYRSVLNEGEEVEKPKHDSSEPKDEPVTMRETRSKRQSKVDSEKRSSTKKELNPGPIKDEDIPFSSVYGFIHFVRFLNQLIEGKNIPVGMLNFYAPLINDLLEFLSFKKNEYYKQEADYEAPPKSYKANQ